MKTLYSILLWSAIITAALTGCFHKRVFQKTVPENVEKPAVQVEGEKRAASFIKTVTKPPVANPVEVVAAVHEVATELSSSLGAPKVEPTWADLHKIIAELRQANLAKDKQLEAWKAFGRKYAGKTIQGTGFDLGPFLGIGGMVGVVALCIFVPGVGFVLIRVVPVLWGMVRRMAIGIEGFAHDMPAEGEKLKQLYLGRKMNEVDKRIIKAKKKKIPHSVIEEMSIPIAHGVSV